MFNKVEFSSSLIAVASKELPNIEIPEDKAKVIANKLFKNGCIFLTKNDADAKLALLANSIDSIVSSDFRQTMIIIFLAAVTLVLAGLKFNGIISSNIFLYGAVGSATLGIIGHFGFKYERSVYAEELTNNISVTLLNENGSQALEDVVVKPRKYSDASQADAIQSEGDEGDQDEGDLTEEEV